MTNNLNFTEELANILIENSTDENLPPGFKTDLLRTKNKKEIMKLKGFYLLNFFIQLVFIKSFLFRIGQLFIILDKR